MLADPGALSISFDRRYGSEALGKKIKVRLYDQVGNEVGEWILRQRVAGLAVVNRDVKRQSLSIAARLNLSTLKAFDNWITDMKKRNGLSQRKSTHTSVKIKETEEDRVGFGFACTISIDRLIG